MGSFAQAAKRQNYGAQFGAGLDKIGQIIANNLQQQKLLEERARKDKQRKDFMNFNVNAGDDLTSLWKKANVDNAISPEESGDINKKLYDYKNQLNQFDLIDNGMISGAGSNLSDLVSNYGKIREPKEETTKNIDPNSQEAFDRKYKMWEKQQKYKAKNEPKNKDEKLTASQILAREKFEYQKDKDFKKKALNKKEAQFNYNKIMGTPYIPVEQLIGLYGQDEMIKQGILREQDGNIFKNYGGAYIYDNGKELKIFKTDKELEEFADQQVFNVPNKWTRDQQGEDDTKFEEGKIYVDANGIKAKYVNGKWVEIK